MATSRSRSRRGGSGVGVLPAVKLIAGRLTVPLDNAQLYAELVESRARIVAAADQTCRRIERDRQPAGDQLDCRENPDSAATPPAPASRRGHPRPPPAEVPASGADARAVGGTGGVDGVPLAPDEDQLHADRGHPDRCKHLGPHGCPLRFAPGCRPAAAFASRESPGPGEEQSSSDDSSRRTTFLVSPGTSGCARSGRGGMWSRGVDDDRQPRRAGGLRGGEVPTSAAGTPGSARMIQQGRRVGTGTAYVYRHVVD